MGDPSRIRELVEGAGFGEPRVEEVKIEWGYSDADEHWEKTLALAAPIADAFAALTPEEQDRARKTVGERVSAQLDDGPGALDGVALAVLAE